MTKRIACLILTACMSTISLAGNFYVGPSLVAQYISASHSSFEALHPTASLGYSNFIYRYYLAGELSVSPSGITLSNRHNNGAVSARTTFGVGISFIPGMLLSDTVLGYLRFGIVDTRFSSPNVMKIGTMIGVGLQGQLTEEWSIRGEYDYTAYKSVSGLGNPKSNAVGLGLLYNFNC